MHKTLGFITDTFNTDRENFVTNACSQHPKGTLQDQHLKYFQMFVFAVIFFARQTVRYETFPSNSLSLHQDVHAKICQVLISELEDCQREVLCHNFSLL
jgi:hypothetical protein